MALQELVRYSHRPEKANTQGVIVEAAQKLLKELGPRCPINTVLAEAGCSKGAVYHYFLSFDEVKAQAILEDSEVALVFLGIGEQESGSVREAVIRKLDELGKEADSDEEQFKNRRLGEIIFQRYEGQMAVESVVAQNSAGVDGSPGIRLSEIGRRLIDGAAVTYKRFGIRASTDDIADAAGLTKGAFCSNFEGKKDFELAMIGNAQRQLAASFGEEGKKGRLIGAVDKALKDPCIRVFASFLGLPETNPDYRKINLAVAGILGLLVDRLGKETAQRLVGALVFDKFKGRGHFAREVYRIRAKLLRTT